MECAVFALKYERFAAAEVENNREEDSGLPESMKHSRASHAESFGQVSEVDVAEGGLGRIERLGLQKLHLQAPEDSHTVTRSKAL